MAGDEVLDAEAAIRVARDRTTSMPRERARVQRGIATCKNSVSATNSLSPGRRRDSMAIAAAIRPCVVLSTSATLRLEALSSTAASPNARDRSSSIAMWCADALGAGHIAAEVTNALIASHATVGARLTHPT